MVIPGRLVVYWSKLLELDTGHLLLDVQRMPLALSLSVSQPASGRQAVAVKRSSRLARYLVSR